MIIQSIRLSFKAHESLRMKTSELSMTKDIVETLLKMSEQDEIDDNKEP